VSPISLGLGVALGVGLWLVVTGPGVVRPSAPPRVWLVRVGRVLDEAGYGRLDPAVVVTTGGLAAVLVGAVVGALVPIPVVSVIASFAALSIGAGFVFRQRAARARTLLAAWPGVIDHVRSAVRSGLDIAPAIEHIPDTVPGDIRRAVQSFRSNIQRGMSTDTALVELGRELADPIADRIIEVLRIAHDVGGTDLPGVLRHLQQSVRHDIAVRDDAYAKQSWIRSASVLAVAAPWVVLLVIGGRGETAAAYQSVEGSALLILGAVVSLVAYLLMRRIGALPAPRRWVA